MPAKDKIIKILIADSHLLIREGVRGLLSKKPEFSIVGEATGSKELAAKVQRLKPDVVMIDYHLPGYFGPEDIANVYKLSPGSNVLVVTTSQSKTDILKVLELGVNNYILKSCDKAEFLDAIYATAKKERFFCGKVIDAVLDKQFPKTETCAPTSLSQREVEIVKHIADGYTNGQIAEKLFLSIHTVSTHRKNILKKLGLKKSAELVAYAIKTGMLGQHVH